MIWDKFQLLEALQDDILFLSEEFNYQIDNIVFDSRRIEENTLFIAKKGENCDGHNFIKNVLETREDSIALAEFYPDDSLKNNPRIILVKNTLEAMKKMAIYRRKQLRNAKIFGITGSLGKTSTKDLLYAVLSKFGKSYCNIMSFNSEIGVLITLINTPADCDYAIFEIGMNYAGELKPLVDIVKPNISIITNVEAAHLGNFSSEDEIAFEKSEILTNTSDFAILNFDNKYYDFLKKKAENFGLNIINFGKNANANIVLKDYESLGNKLKVSYSVYNNNYDVDLNNLDQNLAFNALSVFGVAKILGLDFEKVLEIVTDQECPRGRNNFEIVEYIHNNKNIKLNIINGVYNAVNPKAFDSGFSIMQSEYFKNKRKVCLFGPIRECGEEAENFNLSLKDGIIKSNADVVILFSEEMKKLFEYLKENTNIIVYHFDTSDEIISIIKNILLDDDLLFIKSSKYSKSYKIFNYLSENNQLDMFL